MMGGICLEGMIEAEVMRCKMGCAEATRVWAFSSAVFWRC